MKTDHPLGELLRAFGGEVLRFNRLSAAWPAGERDRVLFGWMGLERLREMNDFLEEKAKRT